LVTLLEELKNLNKNIKVLIFSEKDVLEFKPPENSILIRITGKKDKPRLKYENNYIDVLEITADDISNNPDDNKYYKNVEQIMQDEHPNKNFKFDWTFFGDNDAKKIIKFVNEYKSKVNNIAIHCYAGNSRSVTVGYFIYRNMFNDLKSAEKLQKGKSFNKLFYRTLINNYKG
jgi:predicted protein tyrosine phosphatase